MIERFRCKSLARIKLKRNQLSGRAVVLHTNGQVFNSLISQLLFNELKNNLNLFSVMYYIRCKKNNKGGYSLKVKQLSVDQCILVQLRVSSHKCLYSSMVEQYTVNIWVRCSNHLKGVLSFIRFEGYSLMVKLTAHDS